MVTQNTVANSINADNNYNSLIFDGYESFLSEI